MPDKTTSTVIVAAVTTIVAVVAVQAYLSRKNKTGSELGPTAKIFPDKESLSHELCSFVAQTAQQAISERGVFHLAVAGGSLLDALSKLVEFKDQVDFSKVVLSFANHKCVDPTGDKATIAKCKAKFAIAAGITQFVTPSPVPIEGGDGSAEAVYYAQQLKSQVPHKKGYPGLDLILLGLGADGHVGSCHPMGPAVKETKKSVAGSPKDGEPSSITLTIESMNSAREVGVVVCGGSKGKKEAAKRAMMRPAESPRGTFPAQLLKAPIFFLDMEAAGDL